MNTIYNDTTETNNRNWSTIKTWLNERDEKINKQSQELHHLKVQLATLQKEFQEFKILATLNRGTGRTTK